MPSVIALDAMGSDRAPKPEVEGAIHAARQYGVISRMGEVHRWLIGEQDDIIAPQEALR